MSPIKQLAAEIAALQSRLNELTAKRDAMIQEVTDSVVAKSVADGLAEIADDGSAIFYGEKGNEVSRRLRAAMVECGAWE